MSANDRQVAGSHYKRMNVQPWDVTSDWPLAQQIGMARHGALKYLMRMGSKDAGLQEAEKALHYCEKLVEILKDSQRVSGVPYIPEPGSITEKLTSDN